MSKTWTTSQKKQQAAAIRAAGLVYRRKNMQRGAIDIHHHYVPDEVIGEARQHGKLLGIEVSEDNDGTLRFSFNGGPKYPLLQGLTDVEPRLEMMEKGQIAL